jgi:hypothetical protein
LPNITYPNQRVVNIHRESAKSDFLGIKNTNWQAAARDLGAHALMLYMYLAANADGFNLALSPVAVRQATGMPRSTYQDQFIKLIDKGYLVQESGNKYNFYETPQPSHANNQSAITTQKTDNGLNFEECTPDVFCVDRAVPNVPTGNIEINNNEIQTNNQGINNNGLIVTDNVYIPKVKEIRIPVPKVESKKQITPLPHKKEFIF